MEKFRLIENYYGNEYKTYIALKEKLLYYQYLVNLYQDSIDKHLTTGTFENYITLNPPKVTFNKCINDCFYLKDKDQYRCVHCGNKKEIKKINIQLPTDVLVNIFRSNKSLYYLSRMVSKDIRNAAFEDIMKNEMLYTFSYNDIHSVLKNQSYSHISTYFHFDPCQGESNEYFYMYVDPYCKNSMLLEKMLVWYQYVNFNYNSKKRIEKNTYKTESSERHPHYYTQKDNVDFLSYHRMILKRLSLYKCNHKLIAATLTLNNFNNAKKFRRTYMMKLCASAYVLNMDIGKFDNNIDCEKIIAKFEPIVEAEILKLIKI